MPNPINKPLNTKQQMKETVSDYLTRCIQCHQCMDVCPVTKDSFSIKDLNDATQEGHPVPPSVTQFAFHCVQCGKCVPVCPVNIRRDLMVRYLKYKLRDHKPWGYTRYLLVKGPNRTGITSLIQKLFIGLRKRTTRDLACFMETVPMKKTEVLFYPGCYIYSTKTVRQTLRLLDHLGGSYSVLGGVTACCGTPHLLQGEFDQADQCLSLLHEKIKAVDPKVLLTACAECFEAVKHIKEIYNEKFEVQSIAEYLTKNITKFPDAKTRGKLIVHDSCRFTQQSPQGIAIRSAASTFGELTELAKPHTSSCCYQWNHGHDPCNSSRLTTYLSEIKNSAPILVCNCLTCYEELKKIPTDVEIIDVLQLFEEALDSVKSTEQKP
jgi:Fe-S oxidoreductase